MTTQNKKWYQSTDWLTQVHPSHIGGYILKKVIVLSPVVAYNRLTELISLVHGSRLEFFMEDNETNSLDNECIPFRIDSRAIEEIENLTNSYLEGRNEFLKEKGLKSLQRAISRIETGNLDSRNINRYVNWLTKKLDFRERRREDSVEILGKPTRNNQYEHIEIKKESEFDNKVKERLNAYILKCLKGGGEHELC
jgi:hypothetical protein